MRDEATHGEYYGNISEALGLDYKAGECTILDELLAQTEAERTADEHLNSIELYRWDAMGANLSRLGNYKEVLKERGETDAPAVRVCIVKSAMRKALNRY